MENKKRQKGTQSLEETQKIWKNLHPFMYKGKKQKSIIMESVNNTPKKITYQEFKKSRPTWEERTTAYKELAEMEWKQATIWPESDDLAAGVLTEGQNDSTNNKNKKFVPKH